MSITTYVAALLVLVAPAAFAAPAAAAEPTLEGQNFGAPGGDPTPNVHHWLFPYTPPGPPDIIYQSSPPSVQITPVTCSQQTMKEASFARLFANFPEQKLIVKRDDSIVAELRRRLDDDLIPGVRFTPDEWQSIRSRGQEHLEENGDRSPSNLQTHGGLMDYFKDTLVRHLYGIIRRKESLWVIGVPSSRWEPVHTQSFRVG
ncbi:hypothetical protein IAR50_000590 [Cryptococcus sp. DSM 104548]